MSLCEHGIPRFYRCADRDHENHEHHRCERVVRMDDLDEDERRLVRALLAQKDAPSDRT